MADDADRRYVRGFLGASYLTVLSSFHALDVVRLYVNARAASSMPDA
ncbi:hypothetical protein BH10PSE7_BH10PSE7_15590 [soil metagenome]